MSNGVTKPLLNYRLSQKFKLLGYGKFKHLTNTSNTLSRVGQNYLLIDESQHMEI